MCNEITRVRSRLGDAHRLLYSFAPYAFLHCAKHQIVISYRAGIVLAEQLGQQMLDFVFVGNEQIAIWTIAARVVEGNQVQRIDMNQ